MTKNISRSVSILIVTLILQTSCKTVKPPSTTAQSDQAVQKDKCQQVIRYYAERIKANGQEVFAPTRITINPAARTINILSNPPNEQEKNFDTIIENFNCNLDADLKTGTAVYKGYIKQLDGTSTQTVMTIDATEDGVTITGSSPASTRSGMVIIVTKWEVVSE